MANRELTPEEQKAVTAEIKRQANVKFKAQNALNEALNVELNSITHIMGLEAKRQKLLLQKQSQEQKFFTLRQGYEDHAHELSNQRLGGLTKSLNVEGKKLAAIEKELIVLGDIEKTQERNNRIQKEIVGHVQSNVTGWQTLVGFLMRADKGIKETALNLGTSGQRSEEIRDNFENIAQQAARIGVTVKDLSVIQQVYSTEVGRVALLNEENLISISKMAQGTGLGVENATRLAAQFEILGLNAESSLETVQGILDTSERMGINTTKVLKTLNDNFRAAQKYNFRHGVASMARMAEHSTLFKQDMTGVFSALDKSRTLEGAVEMAAQLQVLGGEFARSDPFELLFLSRNDPELYSKKLTEMTKGLATFRKTANGFEFGIAPMDRDRLRKFAEATGQEYESLIQQTLRLGRTQKISQELLGSGFSPDNKKLITGMAELSKKTGKFTIDIGGNAVEISDLTEKQLKALQVSQTLATDRALAAQTFQDALINAVSELKSALIPVLNVANDMLGAFREWGNNVQAFFGGSSAAGSLTRIGLLGGTWLLAAIAWKATLPLFKGITNFLPNLMAGGKGKTGGMMSQIPQAAGGAGMGMLRGGAGIGAAGIGIGAGAAGIGFLAQSIKDVDVDKLKQMNWTVGLLGATMLGITIAMAAMAPAIGTAGAALLPFGGAVALIGGGIGVAAAGIGFMAKGFAEMSDPRIGANLKEASVGIAGIMGSLLTLSNPLTSLGLVTLTGVIAGLSFGSGNMENARKTFESIVALKGSKEDLVQLEKTIKTISRLDAGGDNVLARLASVLDKGLQIEFKEKQVDLVINNTVEIDGRKFLTASNAAQSVTIQQADFQRGKSAPRIGGG